jgi:UDP-glucose 4-epimerase
MNNSGKGVLVTGGLGFVGTAMVHRLSKSREVTIADRGDFGVEPFLQPLIDSGAVKLIQTDLTRPSDVHERVAAGEFEEVIHLAAAHFIPQCEQQPVDTYRENVFSLLLLLKNLPSGIHLVHFSSAAVYKPAEISHSEDSPLEPCDIYGWTKMHNEDLVRYYAARKQFSAVNIRLFNALGPGETNPHIFGTILYQVQQGRKVIELGNLSPRRDFIHVDDISWGIEELLEQWPLSDGLTDALNLGTGRAISMQHLFEQVRECLDGQISVQTVGQRRRKVERELLCADVSKLLLMLPRFSPRPVEEWLEEVVKNPRLRLSSMVEGEDLGAAR